MDGSASLHLIQPIGQERRNRRSLLNIICCVFDSDDDDNHEVDRQYRSNLRNTLPYEKKEKNQLQLAGINIEGDLSLVRVTQKNFFVDFLQRKNQVRQTRLQKLKSYQLTLDKDIQSGLQPPQIMFSLFEQGVRASQNELINGIPEKVGIYLAKRCLFNPCQEVLIPYCGSGGLLMTIAGEEYCERVVAMEKCETLIDNAIHNSKLYAVSDKVDFIQTTFLKQRLRLNPHSVVIHLPTIPGDRFSLANNTQFEELFNKAMEHSENVIMILPGEADVGEIASVVSHVLVQRRSQIFKFEIQLIQVDGTLDYHIVYVGDVSMTKTQDEYEYSTLFLLQDSQKSHIYGALYDMLKSTEDQVCYRDLLKSMLRAADKAKNQTETLLSVFLRDAVYHQILLKPQVDGFLERVGSNTLTSHQTPRLPHNMNQSAATFNVKSSQHSESKRSILDKTPLQHHPQIKRDLSSFMDYNSYLKNTNELFPEVNTTEM